MTKIAVYPGSFDPPHRGHMYIVNEARQIFDKVIILLSVNPAKKEFLSLEEKYDLWEKLLADDLANNVEVCFNKEDLTAKWMRERNLYFMVRGVRNSRDFDEEMTLFSVNNSINRGLNVIFIPPDPLESLQISSSIVRELVKFKVPMHILRGYTHRIVTNKLIEKFYDKQ